MQLPCNNLTGKITHTVTVTGHTVTPRFINHCGSLDQPTASGRHGIPVDGPGAVVAQSPGLWLNWLGMAGHSGWQPLNLPRIEPGCPAVPLVFRVTPGAAGIQVAQPSGWPSEGHCMVVTVSESMGPRLLWHSDQWPMIELNSRPSTWLEVPGIEPQAASEARVMARQGPLVIMR